MFQRKSLFLPLLIALWLSLCIFGLYKLAIYEHTPALAKNGPTMWPDVGLAKGPGYTLVLSIHPQCPCTRATLQELAIALTHCPNLQAYLLFIEPEGVGETWVKSDLWSTCTTFPRCSLLVDKAGKLSAAFSAHTSGQSYLYDPAGQLIYSGGITQSRGHAGDNEGLNAIIALANREKSTVKNKPVFGCSLFSDGAVCQNKSGNQ